MAWLTWLHRWTGGLIGLVLVVLALSGTLLLWKAEWIGVAGAGDSGRMGSDAIATAITAAQREGELSRITFANAEFGLHQAIYTDGSGVYLNQSAVVVERWSASSERPELWLFDLHHYLLAGETGEIAVGVAGLVLVFFTVSGVILWWRTRRTFAFRLVPTRLTRSAIIRHHRDLGIVVAPLLLLSGVTGAMMIFPAMTKLLLAPWGHTAPPFEPPPVEPPLVDPIAMAERDWRAVFSSAREVFPNAVPRRLQLPADATRPALIRMLQPFEWTPNGRSYVYVDTARAEVVASVDPAAHDTAQAIQEKLYPIHAAAVGGVVWRIALTLGGLALMLLGGLATWSFWFRTRGPVRAPAPLRPTFEPAE